MADIKDNDLGHHTVDFTGLILGFSSAALYYLGEAPIGDQPAGEKNFPLAKQNIDIIDLLRSKTKGNLEAQEAKLLDQILADLKIKYSSLQNT